MYKFKRGVICYTNITKMEDANWGKKKLMVAQEIKKTFAIMGDISICFCSLCSAVIMNDIKKWNTLIGKKIK